MECKKCGCDINHVKEKGPHTGLYCIKCNSWIKWISKEELKQIQEVKTNGL